MKMEQSALMQQLRNNALWSIYNALGRQVLDNLFQPIVDVNGIIVQLTDIISQQFPKFSVYISSTFSRALSSDAIINYVVELVHTIIENQTSGDNVQRAVKNILSVLQNTLPQQLDIDLNQVIEEAAQRSKQSESWASRLLRFLGPPRGRSGVRGVVFQARMRIAAKLYDPGWWRATILPCLQNASQQINAARTHLISELTDKIVIAFTNAIERTKQDALREVDNWKNKLDRSVMDYDGAMRELKGLYVVLERVRESVLQDLLNTITQVTSQQVKNYNNMVESQRHDFWNSILSNL